MDPAYPSLPQAPPPCPGVRSLWKGLTRGIAMMVVLLAATGVHAQQTDMQSVLTAAQERLEKARSNQLDLMTPRTFQRAAENLATAQERLNQNRPVQDIQKALTTAIEALSRAEGLLASGRNVLGTVLESRADALEADAPTFASELWTQAEDVLVRAGREFERDKLEDARLRANQANGLYLRGEFEAIRAALLGEADNLRQQAVAAQVNLWAPTTYQAGQRLLQEGYAILQNDRQNKEPARQSGIAAIAAFTHATYIATTAKAIDEDARAQVEGFILGVEEQITPLAQALDVTPDYSTGFERTADQMSRAIAGLQAQNRQLERDVEAMTDQLVRNDSLAAYLNRELDSAKARALKAEEALSQIRRQKERIRQVRALFAPEEAEVFQNGPALILRLHGMQFAPRSPEIPSENFELLARVQQAIALFPGAPLEIGGHTDAQGNDVANQELSAARAQAIQDYLMAIMPTLDANNVEAVGYGEDYPLMKNETDEGRARNRRIEIHITLPE